MPVTTFRIFLFAAVLAAYIFISFFIAYYFSDPHLVGRFGATLSALGALAIIVQVKHEVTFEHQNRFDQIAAERLHYQGDRDRADAMRN